MTATLLLPPTPEPATLALPPLAISYEHKTLSALLADTNVLAVIGFGESAPAAHDDARYLRVALEPVLSDPPFEVWRSSAQVHCDREGPLHWASDGDYTFGALELNEAEWGGIEATAQRAYETIAAHVGDSRTPHMLRLWNYLDAINEGEGDDERYRRFCNGRAAGMHAAPHSVFTAGYPAATAIGVRDGRRILQVYWLAARASGRALENPRQTSAWRYPREYGPTAPSFARALKAPTLRDQLYISGTAAIVGHRSHHHDDFIAQLDETLINLDSLFDAAQFAAATRLDSRSLLKAYVRRDGHASAAAAAFNERLPLSRPLLLRADICRRELLIEIDGVQNA